jgi:Got1/Sft2-like family
MFMDSIRTSYARLLPGGTNDAEDAEIMHDLGIYEDEESRRTSNGDGSGGGGGGDASTICPAGWCDFLPTLSLRERLLGCATCMVCGYILSFGSFMRMKDLVVGNPVPLVVNVTIGNVIALCGTCFLTGPQSQARRMFHKTRKLASVAYLGSLAVTLFLLMLPHFVLRGLLLFLLMIGQYVAITWYCLSYIPFAREFVTNGCRRLVASSSDGD